MKGMDKNIKDMVEKIFPEKKEPSNLDKIQSIVNERLANTLPEIRQAALCEYYDRLSGRKRTGTRRKVKREVGRWLDKVSAKFYFHSDSNNFYILSNNFRAELDVKVERSKNGYKYYFEWRN